MSNLVEGFLVLIFSTVLVLFIMDDSSFLMVSNIAHYFSFLPKSDFVLFVWDSETNNFFLPIRDVRYEITRGFKPINVGFYYLHVIGYIFYGTLKFIVDILSSSR